MAVLLSQAGHEPHGPQSALEIVLMVRGGTYQQGDRGVQPRCFSWPPSFAHSSRSHFCL